jgi:hypothetical protein
VVTPLDLAQRRFHTLEDGILDVEHVGREGLVKLDDVCFALLKVRVNVFVESVRATFEYRFPEGEEGAARTEER